jgi:hypothetical protein
MYTAQNVSHRLRSVALGVVLLLGAGPAITLACQWVCASHSRQAAHHAGHHGHSSNAVVASHTPVSAPAVRAPETSCDHGVQTATLTTGIQVFPPLWASLDARYALSVEPPSKFAIPSAIGSQTGTRSAPLSLRI